MIFLFRNKYKAINIKAKKDSSQIIFLIDKIQKEKEINTGHVTEK